MFNNPNKSFYFLLTLINIKLTSEYKEINNFIFFKHNHFYFYY